MSAKDDLLTMVQGSPLVKRYKAIETQIENDSGIQHKMVELKALQKQIVHAKEFQKKALLSDLTVKYDSLYDEIETYPLMSEYLALQSEINQMIQEVSEIIQDGIDADFDGKCHNYANIRKKSQKP